MKNVIKINNPDIINMEDARREKIEELQNAYDSLSWLAKWWDRTFSTNSKAYVLNFTKKHITVLYSGQESVCRGVLNKLNAGHTCLHLAEWDCNRLLISDLWNKFPKVRWSDEKDG